MKRNLNLFLEDILDSINLIEKSTKNMSKKEFEENKDIQDATIRRIEIIGEAVKNITLNFKSKYPEVEWKKIAGTRDIFIHAYFKIDLEKIWEVVKKDLFFLKKEIRKILEKERDNKQKKK